MRGAVIVQYGRRARLRGLCGNRVNKSLTERDLFWPLSAGNPVTRPLPRSAGKRKAGFRTPVPNCPGCWQETSRFTGYRVFRRRPQPAPRSWSGNSARRTLGLADYPRYSQPVMGPSKNRGQFSEKTGIDRFVPAAPRPNLYLPNPINLLLRIGRRVGRFVRAKTSLRKRVPLE